LKKLSRALQDTTPEQTRDKGKNERRSREEELWHAVQWTGTPRARQLHEWSFSASTECVDARGSRFVYIYIYKYYDCEATVEEEIYNTRMNKHTQTHVPTYIPTYLHTNLRTHIQNTTKPTNPTNPTTQPYKPYPTLHTYPGYKPYPTTLQTIPYPTHTNNTHMCNENKKRTWLH